MKKDEIYFMKEAFKLAELACKRGEIPVGAVLIRTKAMVYHHSNTEFFENDWPIESLIKEFE